MVKIIGGGGAPFCRILDPRLQSPRYIILHCHYITAQLSELRARAFFETTERKYTRTSLLFYKPLAIVSYHTFVPYILTVVVSQNKLLQY